MLVVGGVVLDRSLARAASYQAMIKQRTGEPISSNRYSERRAKLESASMHAGEAKRFEVPSQKESGA